MQRSSHNTHNIVFSAPLVSALSVRNGRMDANPVDARRFEVADLRFCGQLDLTSRRLNVAILISASNYDPRDIG